MCSAPSTKRTPVVDGHVHIHGCFDPQQVLTNAAINFGRAAAALGLRSPWVGVLLLTESRQDRFFRQSRDAAPDGAAGPWRFRRTAESDSLVAEREGEGPLLLIAGRQVVTRESLEVLAVGKDADYEDGRPIREVLRETRRNGALPVVPWGFGKWWFGRGRLMRELVDSGAPGRLFLGDNGGRLRLSRRPPLFARAEARGITVLPGTDPLPFPSQARRVGSFGFVLDGPIDAHRPAEDLRARLREPATTVVPYGSGERLVPFLRSQVAMQVRMRRRGLRGAT